MPLARQATSDFKGDQVSIKMFNGVPDAIAKSSGSMTSASDVLSDAGGSFSPGSVGKYVVVTGAGAAGMDLVTTISQYTSTTSVRLAIAASTTVSNVPYWFGTDNGILFDEAMTSTFVGELFLTKGSYLIVSGSLRFKAGLQLRGKGLDDTVVYLGPSMGFQGPNSTSVADNIKHCKIGKLSIKKAGSVLGTGISLRGLWNSMVDMIRVSGFSMGIDLDGTDLGCYFNEVSCSRIENCTIGIRLTGGNGQAANSNTVRDNRIEGSTTGILGVAGSNICQGNLLARNDIEDLVGSPSICIDWNGDNSVIVGNWVESVATAGRALTGIKVRGVANQLLNNKYAMVASGGTVTQLDWDRTQINTIIETSTGGDSNYTFMSGFNSLLVELIATSGPPRLRFNRQDANTLQRFCEWGISGTGLSSPFNASTNYVYLAIQDNSAATLFLGFALSPANGDAFLHGSLSLNGTPQRIIHGTTGDPNGGIAGSVGDLIIDGNGTGLWFKASGTNTNTGWVAFAQIGSVVTSVALTMPAEFSVSGSPITTSGTLAVTAVNQSANAFHAGPTGGGAATPTFRAMVNADLPVSAGAGGGQVLTLFGPTTNGFIQFDTHGIIVGYQNPT